MAYTLGFSKKKKKKSNLGQILTIHSTVGSFPSKNAWKPKVFSKEKKKTSILAKFGPNLTYLFATMAYTLGLPQKKKKTRFQSKLVHI